ELTVPFSGEHPVVLVPEGFDGGGPYTVSWSCTSGCDATFGRYPLFMMHGMGTLGPDDGLSRYTAVLKANGYVAHAPRVDPFHGTAFRTERWREHFDAWREGGTFRRVHVIAHSMGGIDARNLATHGDPDHRIQTLTTLGTPHRGSPVADLTLDVFEAGVGQQTLEWAADRLAALLTDGSSDDQDLTTQLVDLSTSGMEAFNEVTPDRDDVVYRSWLGVTCGWLSFGCQSMFSGEVASWELHPILPFIEDTSDGLVTFDSAVWGEVQGVFAADHMDLNGSGGPTGHFDTDGFILREAARLVAWENGEEGPIEEQAFSLAETRAWFED
ncbi:MAG: hypothetical protein KC656_27590, partial [Myxococcales bacterium]|nr:hypothetical protein [Myxococcales bacterium]